MTQPNNGGPAFPRAYAKAQEDIGLRDWFAGQALAGILAGGSSWNSVAAEVMKNKGIWGDVSTTEIAYLFADAMLKARSSSE